MKLQLFLVGTALLMSACADSHQTKADTRVLDLIKGIHDQIRETLLEAAPKMPIDPSARANLIYGIIQKLLLKKITEGMDYPVIGKPDGALYVENGRIIGAPDTYINIDVPNAGYNINNLTVFIPYLNVTADKYAIKNLSVEGITLDGEGTLQIQLEKVQLYGEMEIVFQNLAFSVKSITGFSFNVDSSLFELENLGEGGELISSLLNDIASKLFVISIKSANNDLQALIEESGGNCDDSMETLCLFISEFLTYLKNNLQ